MTPTEIEETILRLSLKDVSGYRLGTPVIDGQDPDLLRLVNAGTAAIPQLLSMLDTSTARQAAWIVAALGRIGDPSVLPALKEICARWEIREPEDEWNHAVRGQCRLALDQLAPEST